MPECWEIAVAGVSADTGEGSNCSNYNGTFVLEHVSDCDFTNTDVTGMDMSIGFFCDNGGSGDGYIITYHPVDGPSGWALGVRGEGGTIVFVWYELTSGDPCAGDDLQFDFYSYPLGSCCIDWPSSITATPTTCP